MYSEPTRKHMHQRAKRPNSSARGYDRRWEKARKAFLAEHPLCAFCEAKGRVTAATVVDHIKPHRGCPEMFWDVSNWQPLCKRCHDSDKQRLENGAVVFGADGWPIEPDHAAHRKPR